MNIKSCYFMAIIVYIIFASRMSYADLTANTAGKVRAVDNNEGGVVLLMSENLEDAYKKSKYYGNKFVDIAPQNLPDRTLRNFWEIKNGTVLVNKEKYDQWKAKQDALNLKISEIKAKLNLTDEEWKIFKTEQAVPKYGVDQ